jgi:hypothetical protein
LVCLAHFQGEDDPACAGWEMPRIRVGWWLSSWPRFLINNPQTGRDRAQELKAEGD